MSNNGNLLASRRLLQYISESSWPEAPSRVHLPKPVESPYSIHQAGDLVSVHCLTLLDKQALCLFSSPRKASFHLVLPVKSFLTTTLWAAESLLIPTAPVQLQQLTTTTHSIHQLLPRYSSLYSCLQLHYTLLATYLILGFQPLTLLPFLSLIIKKHC